MQRCHHPHRARGFTLIELLVVIGIILLLMSILLPVVSQIRKAAYDTSTQSQMQRIMQACESYYHDFNAYPGPIANVNLSGGPNPVSGVPQGVTGGNNQVTGSENLVLGLLGFLTPPSGSTGVTFVPASTSPPHDVLSLNPLHPASYHYLDYVPNELTTDFEKSIPNEQGLPSTDTNVPEFIDRFPKPLPILYIRANVGAPGIGYTNDSMQYNYGELAAYGCNIPLSDGTGVQKLLSTSPDYFSQTLPTYTAPNANPGLSDEVQTPFFDWAAAKQNPTTNTYDGWLANPNIQGSPRGKDGFILIAAGKDRVYGTHDDTIITP